MANGIFNLKHQVTSSINKTWTPLNAATVPTNFVEYLIVAGGGGGAIAGGGAGGLLMGFHPISPSITYTVTVGGAGTGGPNESLTPATVGQDSTFGLVTALGGGKGGTWYSTNVVYGLAQGSVGGSGGGSAGSYSYQNEWQGGSGIPGQGFDGGYHQRGEGPHYASGGGGAGGPGQTSRSDISGGGAWGVVGEADRVAPQ